MESAILEGVTCRLARLSLALLCGGALCVTSACTPVTQVPDPTATSALAPPVASTRVWTTTIGGPVAALGKSAATGHVAVGTSDGRVALLSASGARLWSRQVGGHRVAQVSVDDSGTRVLAVMIDDTGANTPIVWECLVFDEGGEVVFRCQLPTDGDATVRLRRDGQRVLMVATSPAVGSRPTSSSVSVIDPDSGRTLWIQRLPGAEYCRVDATDSFERVAVGSIDSSRSGESPPTGRLAFIEGGVVVASETVTVPVFPSLLTSESVMLVDTGGGVRVRDWGGGASRAMSWSASTGGFPGSVHRGDGTVLVASYSRILEGGDSDGSELLELWLLSTADGRMLSRSSFSAKGARLPVTLVESSLVALVPRATGAKDQALVIETRNGLQARSLPSGTSAVALTRANDELLTGTADGSVTLLHLTW
jgi:hypothetical protein